MDNQGVESTHDPIQTAASPAVSGVAHARDGSRLLPGHPR
jgi:hypothetical protein